MKEPSIFSERENNFGLLRLFAASQVMIVHGIVYLGLSMPSWIDAFEMFSGVSIFFVISGFLISESWVRSKSLGDYIVKRGSRIYPAYLISLLATIFIVFSFGFPVFSASGIKWIIFQLVGLVYTPAMLDQYGIGSYNGSLWTIPVEVQFYILIPVVIAFSRWTANYRISISLITLLSLVAALGITWSWLPSLGSKMSLTQDIVAHSFAPYFYMFMSGVWLRAVNAHKSRLIVGKGLYWCIIFILLNVLLPNGAGYQCISRLFLAPTTISIAYSIPSLSKNTIGEFDLSYGIYIYHAIWINLFVELGFTGHWFSVAALMAAAVVSAAASWLLIERPALGATHRHWTSIKAKRSSDRHVNTPAASE